MIPIGKVSTNKAPDSTGLQLSKQPKNPIIIEGFPGFGLVGTIATEFLIEHLKTEEIGKIWFEDLPAVVAIHDGKIINPVGIFYNSKYNIVIVHSISGAAGVEWKTADIITKLAKELNAREVICLEGVGTTEPVLEVPQESEGEMAPENQEVEKIKTLYCGNNSIAENKLAALGVEKLSESILMGIVPALLLKNQANLTCIFAETHSQLPDSKAAARLIQILDKYLGLDVDCKPLLEMAEKFEQKLRGIYSRTQQVAEETKEKKPSYFG